MIKLDGVDLIEHIKTDTSKMYLFAQNILREHIYSPT